MQKQIWEALETPKFEKDHNFKMGGFEAKGCCFIFVMLEELGGGLQTLFELERQKEQCVSIPISTQLLENC
jgi:hypothetical protein